MNNIMREKSTPIIKHRLRWTIELIFEPAENPNVYLGTTTPLTTALLVAKYRTKHVAEVEQHSQGYILTFLL